MLPIIGAKLTFEKYSSQSDYSVDYATNLCGLIFFIDTYTPFEVKVFCDRYYLLKAALILMIDAVKISTLNKNLFIEKFGFIKAIVSLLHLLVAVFACNNYSGNSLVFLLFAFVYLILLVVSLSSLNSPSFMYFGIMLWLGFFLKTSVHLIFQYPFTEPTGNFSGHSHHWDEVLIVASLGCCGAIVAKKFYDFSNNGSNQHLFKLLPDQVPFLFKSWFIRIYLIFTLVMISVALINTYLGIYLIGIVPITILKWPMNGIIAWLLYMGFPLLICHFSIFEFSLTRKNFWNFGLVICEGLISAVSTISRGMFIYHTLPYMIVLFLNREKLSLNYKKIGLRGGILVITFLASLSAVTMLRKVLYDFNSDALKEITLVTESKNQKHAVGYSMNETVGKAFGTVDFSFLPETAKLITSQISGLVVDRWIGAEGAMAVVSYPEKEFRLLSDSLTKKAEVGVPDIYSKISNSYFWITDRFIFASIPGPIAFLYYSDSLLIVFVGMFLIVYLLQMLDFAVFYMFKNAFLSSFLGFYLANSFAQFGVAPRQFLVPLGITSIALSIFWLVLRSKKIYST